MALLISGQRKGHDLEAMSLWLLGFYDLMACGGGVLSYFANMIEDFKPRLQPLYDLRGHEGHENDVSDLNYS